MTRGEEPVVDLLAVTVQVDIEAVGTTSFKRSLRRRRDRPVPRRRARSIPVRAISPRRRIEQQREFKNRSERSYCWIGTGMAKWLDDPSFAQGR
jgi:hypothetical protein